MAKERRGDGLMDYDSSEYEYKSSEESLSTAEYVYKTSEESYDAPEYIIKNTENEYHMSSLEYDIGEKEYLLGEPDICSISQLIEWYRQQNLPDFDITRFYIGTNYRGARAFGIYTKGDDFIVYKNMADGKREIEYSGDDEALAVRLIYRKLLFELDNQRKKEWTYSEFYEVKSMNEFDADTMIMAPSSNELEEMSDKEERDGEDGEDGEVGRIGMTILGLIFAGIYIVIKLCS